MSDPSWRAETTFVIPFHDVDMMGIVWHGNYAKYFELARTELLGGLGYDHREMLASGFVWPVIEMHVRYGQPLRCGQWVTVSARISEYESRLRIVYGVRDADSGQRLTRGYTVQVALGVEDGEMRFESPPVLLQKLGVTTA